MHTVGPTKQLIKLLKTENDFHTAKLRKKNEKRGGVGASQCKIKKKMERKRKMQDLNLELHLSDMAEIDLKA